MGNPPGEPEQTQTVPERAVRSKELVFVQIISVCCLTAPNPPISPAFAVLIGVQSQSWRLDHISLSLGALLDVISRGRWRDSARPSGSSGFPLAFCHALSSYDI